jgi:hypothetical protein
MIRLTRVNTVILAYEISLAGKGPASKIRLHATGKQITATPAIKLKLMPGA